MLQKMFSLCLACIFYLTLISQVVKGQSNQTSDSLSLTSYTIFSSFSPTQGLVTISTAISYGLSFYSTVGGYVTGVRFYKPSGSTGSHIGRLSSNSCSVLATVVFTSETTSGWQQVSFSSRVAISANTTYIVSYFAPRGNVAYDSNFFTTGAQFSNGPLHTVVNNNGRSIMGNACPNTISTTGDYGYVDLVFEPYTQTSPPTVSPTSISSTSPSLRPSSDPSIIPSVKPTFVPSIQPSWTPTFIPSSTPSFYPSDTPTYIPTSSPSFIPTYMPSTIAPTIDPSHYSTNSFNVTQNLVNVTCSDFQSDVAAQNAFKLTILNSIAETGAVLPQLDILQITCTSTTAATFRKFLRTNAYVIPTIAIDYQLSYTSASTEISVINAIYQAVTETLTSAVSSGNFTTALHAIAEKYGIQILLQASSTDTTSTPLSYTIIITSTTPSAAPTEITVNNKSHSSNGSQTMKVAFIAVACILIAAMLGAGGLRYKYGPFKFKKDAAINDDSNQMGEFDNWTRSENDTLHKSRIGTTMNNAAIQKSFIFSSKNPLSATIASSTSSGWSLQKSQFGISAIAISKSMDSNNSSSSSGGGGGGGVSNITGRKSSKSTATIIPRVEWSELDLLQSDKKIQVLGQGSFGVIIKAKYNGHIKVESSNVAIKVIIKETPVTKNASSDTVLRSTELQKQLQLALEEAGVMIDAESKIANKDSIVKVYGVADGIVPAHLLKALNISASKNMEAVGIVMRLEEGGTLESVIYNKAALAPLPMTKKLRLLADIARGLAELHSVGIIHGDIKPANVLLSGDDIPLVRLADFGLSIIRKDHKQVIESTLAHTSHYKGTPLYSAPEMFINPFLVTSAKNNYEDTEKVAKASRKSDMYAFAVLAWEVLSQSKPFDDIKSETILGVKLHQGHRPSVDKLPSDCPSRVVAMIEKCWNTDRSRRRSAVECFSILQDCYNLSSDTDYDIYLSYEMNHIYLGNHVFHRLCQMGYKVCISEEVGVARCKIVIPLLSEHYQADEVCMNELRVARQLNPPRVILPVFVDECQEEWVGNDLKVACQLLSESSASFDISDIAHDSNWSGDNGASQETNRILCKELDSVNIHIVQYLLVS